MEIRREVFFLDSAGGQRFAIVSRPGTPPVGGLLYLHPFAEEMNRSRRMAALAARAFAQQGWLVLQVDMFGCGDSAGDFGDARWQGWRDDVSLGWRWLQANCSEVPLALWTLRAGSLLAADWLEHANVQVPLLLWQPVANGRQYLTQFLRMKAAAEMLGEADARTVMAKLRAELDVGRAVEVAGYSLSSDLAAGLAAANLQWAQSYSAPVVMLEVVASEPAEPSPALAALLAKWREGGVPSSLQAVRGPAFWQTQEVEVVPALIADSSRALQRFLE